MTKQQMTCAPREDSDQITLGIRPVWWESSLYAWRKLESLATHWAANEDSDQTGQMLRLIWVFAGRKVILSVLLWGSSNTVFLWSDIIILIKILMSLPELVYVQNFTWLL